MRLLWGSFVCGALACAAVACQPALTKYGPPGECQIDSGNCGHGFSGGAGTGTGGGLSTGVGGAGGAEATADFNGTVHIITSPSFDDVAMKPLTTAATVIAAGPGGQTVTSMYPDPNAMPVFDIPNALQGTRWVLVQDATNGGASILSTWSVASITSPPVPAVLPVIDLDTLQNIATSIPSIGANGVSPNGAQVILVVYRNNAPIKGITLASGGAGAAVAYDQGPGTYTDQTMATGTAGTIILFNAGLNGSSDIVLKDTSNANDPGTGYTITAQQGAATLVRVEI